MSSQIQISLAEPTDLDIVLRILNEAAKWLEDHDIPTVWTPGAFSRETFLTQISQGEVYIGLLDGEPVGTFVLQWSDLLFWGVRSPNSGYVHKLAVRPSYGGNGIGVEMLRWAEARARSKGKRFLRLNCLADDRKIRDYYEKAGFEHRSDVQGPRAMASLYEKPL